MKISTLELMEAAMMAEGLGAMPLLEAIDRGVATAIEQLVAELGLILVEGPLDPSSRKSAFTLRDPDNNRIEKAMQFAELLQERNPEFQVDLAREGRDVQVEGITLRFKNEKTAGGNKGHHFENAVAAALQERNLSSVPAAAVFQVLNKQFGSSPEDVVKVEMVGAANVRRTLDFKTGIALPRGVRPGEFDKIGLALSDINLTLADGRLVPVSLKSGPRVTLINAGVAGGKREYWGDKVASILELFGGVDIERVIDGFEVYEGKSSTKQAIPRELINLETLDMETVQEFILHAMGAEYILLHDNHAIWISPQLLQRLVESLKPQYVAYPGPSRKRFDMLFSSPLFTVLINIRNKQGGLYPSHIMADYVLDWEAVAELQ